MVGNWVIVYSKQAQKDAKHLTRSGLRPKAEHLLAIIEDNPYQTPPRFERLVGELSGLYSRRINYQHRLVYDIDIANATIHVLSMWTRYETV